MLYETRDVILEPLTKLLTTSLESGKLSDDWKTANVTPIFKKGRKSDPNNYRPVSLTSAVCKLMETVIRDGIVNHVENQNLLSPAQHGFRSHRSCSTQLIEVIHDWANSLDDNTPVDSIYLDYRKAFDSVPFERLLAKLHAYGIRGKIHQWIRNILHNRKQTVVINTKPSDWVPVTSGIPQGSVLGPVLFLIYVNDLPDIVSSTVKLFADDTKIYRPIHYIQDQIIIQQDLNNIYKWSQVWQLPFNVEKCKVLHIGKNNNNQVYSLNSHSLQQVLEEKDLGVTFDSL